MSKSKYDYNKCYELALKCKYRTEFYRYNHQAYRISKRNGWINDYTWFKSGVAIKGEEQVKWTYDACCEESKKYKSRSEFRKNSGSAYNRARSQGWLDKFTWLKPKIKESLKDFGEVYWIYGYFDFGNRTCYIGLSRDKGRHKGHQRKDSNGKFDSVMTYFNDKYGYLPEPVILEENLTADEARNKEAFYIQFFSERKYTIINKAKPGSLGGVSIKWTKEACYEESKKYTYLIDFMRGSASAYQAARVNGWIKEFTWLERKISEKGHWNNYDNCYNEAKKYKSRHEFDRGSSVAYETSRKNGWLDKFVWLNQQTHPKGYWTYEKCKEEAQKYKSRYEFLKNVPGACDSSRRNGWLDEFFPKDNNINKND